MEVFSSTVKSKKQLTYNVVELELEKPTGFNFIPGQYIGLQLEFTARSYSLLGLPNDDNLKLCVKLVEDGIGSNFVKNLKVGDAVEFNGPYGGFVLNNFSNSFLFIATGVGVAPIVSLISLLRQVKYKGEVLFLFGLRSEEDIFYHDLFNSFAKDMENFKFLPFLSKPHSGWQGERGRVTDYLKQHPDLCLNRKVYVCGGQGMVTDSRDILLNSGVLAENIAMEIFT